MLRQTFDINMIPDSEPVIVRVNQYDIGMGRLVFNLYNGTIPYDPAPGSAVTIQGTKPDKHGFSYNASLSGSVVTARLDQQMTAVAGDVRCQLVVTETTGKTGTFVFILRVQEAAVNDETIISDTEIPAIIDAAEANAERAEAAVSHYPKIVNDYWYVWDAENGTWVNTNVRAKGIDGSGAVSVTNHVISFS